MEKLNDTEYSNKPVSNDLYKKAAGAVKAGIIKAFSDYTAMDKGTIHPNKSEKSLHGEGIADKKNMGSEKENTPN